MFVVQQFTGLARVCSARLSGYREFDDTLRQLTLLETV
jgi:hypothetical protein